MTTLTDTETPELVFDSGLPGFNEARRFTLVRIGGEDSLFSMLRSADDSGLEFVVVPPEMFFPEYAPEIDDDVALRLGLDSAEDALLLVIVTIVEPLAGSTANLLGPIVVNRRTRQAVQAVLDPGSYSTREALLPA